MKIRPLTEVKHSRSVGRQDSGEGCRGIGQGESLIGLNAEEAGQAYLLLIAKRGII